jgi:bifunctional non-homologous end joining protein LigD
MQDDKLEIYRRKRDFKSTPEPHANTVAQSSQKPVFVVQLHAASRLHYDFRIEIDGVLKSWALPKGPSISHQDKRLAIQTEDHPLEYQNFEGIIPEGNYGAGIVLIWDRGYFEYQHIGSSLINEYNNGHVIITLYGKKLRGGYILQRFRKANHTQWLFIKLKDKYDQSNTRFVNDERSVVSGKTLEDFSKRSY